MAAMSDIYGLRKAVTKQIDLTIPQYNGTARDGDLIIDMNPGNTQYMIFVGMENGFLTDLIANNALFANFANYAGNVTVANQPNITTVGTLTNLAVAGNALIGGNLVVDGNITYINITNLQVEDPIIIQGGGPNGAPLTSNDGKDRGSLLQVYDTAASAQVSKFMGWDNSAEQFILGSNVTDSMDVITVNTYGNLRLDTLLGSNVAVTGNIDAFDLNAANTVTAIVDVNAGNSISATLDITAGGNMVASGNIDAVGNIAGDNISATVDLVAGANVNAIGNVNAGANVVATGNVSALNIDATANLNSANLTVTTGNVDFTTTANVSLGTVGNVKITGGVSGQVLRTDGAGVLSWVNANTAPGGAGANTQVVFNDAGVMGAVSTFTYNKATDILSVGNVSLTANLSVGGEVLTDLIPTGNKIYDLGNATNRWGNIYLSNNSLYLGAVHVTSDDVSVVNIPNVATANVAATGNVVAANITANVDIVATGNVTGGNLVTSGTVSAFDITVTDAYVTANITVTDTVTASNLVTTGTNVDFTTATTFTVGANTSLSGTSLLSDVFVSRADTSGLAAFDCGTADYFQYTVSGPTTFTATNVPAAGRVCSIIVEVVNGGSAAITYFTGTKWPSATAPTLTAAGTDVLGFYTVDGGTSWTGLVLGLNVS